MNKNIITTEDLLGYLKIPDSESKDSQEVLIRKITQQQILKGESIALRVFELTYKRVSIPQKLYIDDNNIIYVRHRFSAQDIFYKPISYERNSAVYTEDQIPGSIVTLIIPEEIYNTNYQFYINQQNQIVASVQAVKIDHVKNYIAYNPSSFSYLKEHPLLTYYYTNVYGVSANEKIKIRSYTREGLVHRFPIVTKTFEQGYTYRLSYYYKEKEKEVRYTRFLNESPIAISIYVKDLSAVVSFLNKTIFWYYNEFNDYQSKWRKLFLAELTYNIIGVLNSGGNIKKKVAVIYHLPEPLYYVFHNIPSLWYLLRILAKGYIRNVLGINEEDLILKLLRIIYHRSTNKLKKTGTNNTDTLEEETKNNIQQNTSFITNLVTQQVDGQLLLYKLIVGLNGEQFRTYVRFIWSIWKNSSYAITIPKLNKHVAITSKSPVYLDYRSNKILGFHLDNADISWNGKLPQILIKVRVKTGTKEVPSLINIGDSGKPRYIETGDTEIIDNYEAKSYNYHPFSPVILKNSDNPTFILKGEENSSASSITLPAFLIFANNDAAFWENILTGVEYALDVVTTVSGVINLIKVGRLYNILKGGKTLFFRTAQATKAITGAKAAAGLIEVSSGTVNTFLKLTGKNDTELGKTVAKYLFYLEMLSLAGEATVLLKGKLTKTAKELLDNPKFEKSLDDLVKKGELDEVGRRKLLKEINEVAEGVGDYSARLAKIVSRKLDKTPNEIRNFENQFKLKENEWGGVFNKRTKYKNHHTSNLQNEIIWPESILKNIKNCIVTHNHPLGTGLSIEDLKFFLSNKLVELRAIGPDGTVFSVRNGKVIDENNIKFIDYNKDLELLNEAIETIEEGYKFNYSIAVGNTSSIDAQVFRDIFDLIKDKVTYRHYIK